MAASNKGPPAIKTGNSWWSLRYRSAQAQSSGAQHGGYNHRWFQKEWLEGSNRHPARTVHKINALHRSRDLEVLISEVKRNGVFNREVVAMGVRANDTEGFEDFDPSTEQGRQRRVLLQKLVVTFFGKSADRQLSEDKARAVLDGLQILFM